MNTAVYAGVIGVKLGYSLEELRNLIFAAMVHDAGKLLVSITYRLRATSSLYNLVYPFYVIPAEELPEP